MQNRKMPSRSIQTRYFTPEEITALGERVRSDEQLQRLAARVQASLVERESQVLRCAQRNRLLNETLISPSGRADEIEFGLVAHRLNYPTDPATRSVSDAWKAIVGELPPTRISPDTHVAMLQATDVVLGVADDGGIFGDGTYELLDPAGLSIFAEYIWHYFFDRFASFTVKNVVVPAVGASAQDIKIALIGDWGTGPYTPAGPAADVMRQVRTLNPDYIIHLGDIYYSGTATEEQDNLLTGWAGVSGKSFTLNSNHEMYDGGFGYFQAALTNSIFSAQQDTSYFALQYSDAAHGGPWTILALDSAYWSTSAMVMAGSISDPASPRAGANAQSDFIAHLGVPPAKVIVLTHHNPISYDGTAAVQDGAANDLLLQVQSKLGQPAAWYWGHVHNGVVYSRPSVAGGLTRCRCLGHGAIPFGPARGLAAAENPTPPQSRTVEWYANVPNPDPLTVPRVLNGFVLLTITMTGAVTDVFYDQNGAVAYGPQPYQLG